jgi:uncharacterized protein (DUF1697 family)
MTTYIALLRGINVGGHNKLKMESLRELCKSLKFQRVETYVQSGNIVFQAKDKDSAMLAFKLETAIELANGFRPTVICRTATELTATAARNPFFGREQIESSRLGVCFLGAELSSEAREKILKIKTDPEELHFGIQELFIYFPNGMGQSKLSMAAIERAAKTAITVRNWNTVTKLIEMAGSEN